MTLHDRFFINVEDALNFIELHESQDDLHLYVIPEEGGVKRKKSFKKVWAQFLHLLGFDSGKKVKLQILKEAISHLRVDFAAIHNDKITQSIKNLETLIAKIDEKAKRHEKWDLDPIVSELRRFRVALRNDAELKLKRLQIMVDAAQEKITKLEKVDRRWIPSHILDFLCEIDDLMITYDEERRILERGHRVYSSFIDRSKEIEQKMEQVRQSHLNHLPGALNWGVNLSLLELSENGIPELSDAVRGNIFEISPDYVHQAQTKYQQLRKLYLKHHAKMRADLKGSFDNNFAEYEARLYYAQKIIEHQQKG